MKKYYSLDGLNKVVAGLSATVSGLMVGNTVVANLTSTSDTDMLAASQGKVLDDKITAVSNNVSSINISIEGLSTLPLNGGIIVPSKMVNPDPSKYLLLGTTEQVVSTDDFPNAVGSEMTLTSAFTYSGGGYLDTKEFVTSPTSTIASCSTFSSNTLTLYMYSISGSSFIKSTASTTLSDINTSYVSYNNNNMSDQYRKYMAVDGNRTIIMYYTTSNIFKLIWFEGTVYKGVIGTVSSSHPWARLEAQDGYLTFSTGYGAHLVKIYKFNGTSYVLTSSPTTLRHGGYLAGSYVTKDYIILLEMVGSNKYLQIYSNSNGALGTYITEFLHNSSDNYTALSMYGRYIIHVVYEGSSRRTHLYYLKQDNTLVKGSNYLNPSAMEYFYWISDTIVVCYAGGIYGYLYDLSGFPDNMYANQVPSIVVNLYSTSYTTIFASPLLSNTTGLAYSTGNMELTLGRLDQVFYPIQNGLTNSSYLKTLYRIA